MSTVPHQFDQVSAGEADGVPLPRRENRLHRLGEVRRQQGVSLRRVARALKIDIRQVRQQEEAESDLPLSVLYLWQRVLDVPIADLLVENEETLSQPVLQRARLVKLMKTVVTILERTESPAIRRLAQTMIDQLVEIMPELTGVGPWHAVGQRRTLDEYGRAAERRLSEGIWRDL